MLEINDIHVSYGAIRALKGVSCQVDQGEIVALIGANGAGKTTTLRTISGLIRPHTGAISYKGQNLTKLPPHQIVNLGLSQVPEGRRVFTRMTVLENLEMGAYSRKDKANIKLDIKKFLNVLHAWKNVRDS